MPRKSFNQLSKATQKRYARFGISASQYDSGMVTPERKQEIYGKRKTSWMQEIAKQKGITATVPVFDTLPKDRREALTDSFLGGVVDRRRPFVTDEFGNPRGLNKLQQQFIPQNEIEISLDENGFERYFHVTYDANGRRIKTRLNSYGKPLRSGTSIGTEMDFEEQIDEFGLRSVLHRWNDAIRETLSADSPKLGK